MKEFVQVKVYETLQNYLRDLERYQLENREISQDLVQARSQYEREQLERTNLQKQLKDSREDAQRRIEALEKRNHELQTDLNSYQNQLRIGDKSRSKTDSLEE